MPTKAKTSGSEKRQRAQLVGVRFSEQERAELIRRADACGVGLSTFLRMQALDVPPPRASRKPPVDRAAVAQLLAQIGKLGSNVNQIAHHLNAGGPGSSRIMAEAIAAVIDMRAACLEALGRKP